MEKESSLLKIAKSVNKFNFDFSKTYSIRIFCGIFVGIFVFVAIINSILPTNESKLPEDTNVYLNEEIKFAKDIYINVVGMSVQIMDFECCRRRKCNGVHAYFNRKC